MTNDTARPVASTAVRIQRRRTKGWRAPENAVYVGRGSRWGNPFWIVPTDGGFAVSYNGGATVATFTRPDAQRYAVDAYRQYLPTVEFLAEAARRELAGRDLMCWCPPELPCHADVLLELAAGGEA